MNDLGHDRFACAGRIPVAAVLRLVRRAVAERL
jgi:hypothetical protein